MWFRQKVNEKTGNKNLDAKKWVQKMDAKNWMQKHRNQRT